MARFYQCLSLLKRLARGTLTLIMKSALISFTRAALTHFILE